MVFIRKMCDINANMCRICLTKKKDDFKNLFAITGGSKTNSAENISLSESGIIYTELFQMAILTNEYNVQPSYICPYCNLQLKLFHKFKTRAAESYETFASRVFCKEEEIALNAHQDSAEKDYTISEQPEIDESLDECYENNEAFKFEADEEEFEEFEEVQYLMEDDGLSPSRLSPNRCEMAYFTEEESSSCSDFKNALDVCNEYESDVDVVCLQDSHSTSSLTNKKIAKNKENMAAEGEQCTFCNAVFHEKWLLMEHIKEHRNFKCDLCAKKFYTEQHFKAHMNVHNGLPAYQCSECLKTFKQKVHFNYHMRKHRNERTEICEICGKSFLSKNDLLIHGRSHSNERRYACDICDKRFRIHTHLVNHRYVHFENQLECDICHQKYRTPVTLQTHIRSVHLKLKPHECNECGRKFKRRHHLKQHANVHVKSTGFLKKKRQQNVPVTNVDGITGEDEVGTFSEDYLLENLNDC